MKRFLIIASMLLCGIAAQAQTFFVEAGYANLSYKGNVELFNSKFDTGSSLNGFYIGLGADVNFTKYLALLTGVKYQFAAKSMYGIKRTDMSLVVPVQAKFNLPIGSAAKAFLFAGPSLQCGLQSQMKYENFVYDNYDDDFKRCQLLLGGGVGLEIYDVFGLKVSCDYGVLNMYKAEGSQCNNLLLNAGIYVKF